MTANGPKTLLMGIIYDIMSCWTTLGPFQRPSYKLGYVRLSQNLYIPYVRLSRNLYIPYVRLSQNLYIPYVRLRPTFSKSPHSPIFIGPRCPWSDL